MREVGGEFAESGELFGLLLHAGDFADAVEQDGDAALAHGGDGEEQSGEEVLMEIERPGLADGEAIAAVGLHAGVGEFAGHLSGAADEEGHGAGVAASDVDLAAEDEVEVDCGLVLAEDEVAIGSDALGAVGGDPG